MVFVAGFTHASTILHRIQILDVYLISPRQYTLVSQTLEYHIKLYNNLMLLVPVVVLVPVMVVPE